MNKTIIETKNLCKYYNEGKYNEVRALDKVNIKIKKGEFVSVIGHSGSGKSTLLHLLGMLDKPDSGSIYYSGKEINVKDKKVNEFRNKIIGFVFQFHYLLEDFTAEENVAMPMFLATKNFKKSINKAHNLLKSLDIYERRYHFPNQLSGGEQQRVAVARALINDPEIVLADEPTGNLDAIHSQELIDLLINLNYEKKQTFVIISHSKEIALKMDKHYILKNGILNEF
ncbi:MAG: lipoprotein-releasing system ATP-binding protein LolD [Promethearchaeia archaeon]|nr:MAG: lipoprotein-releasing system ATP-binding protein LolD [Candidatus Lokiarchaeia archaeon]